MTMTLAGTKRVQRRRDKLRATGLRPVQIWVPDTRAAGFAEECARQARLIRATETHDILDEEGRAEVSDTACWTA
jgi:hypothetical protein